MAVRRIPGLRRKSPHLRIDFAISARLQGPLRRPISTTKAQTFAPKARDSITTRNAPIRRICVPKLRVCLAFCRLKRPCQGKSRLTEYWGIGQDCSTASETTVNLTTLAAVSLLPPNLVSLCLRCFQRYRCRGAATRCAVAIPASALRADSPYRLTRRTNGDACMMSTPPLRMCRVSPTPNSTR